MVRIIKLQIVEQVVRVFYVITLILLFTVLYGCVTGSTIIAGSTRPAINPSEVKIYLDPPTKYETLGLVEASLLNGWYKRQKTQDKVINKLKYDAAKIGANGVLLITSGDKTVGFSGGYFQGIFGGGFSGSAYEKVIAKGKAIYVIQE